MQRKVMISCAVTGSADTPGRNPAVPAPLQQRGREAGGLNSRPHHPRLDRFPRLPPDLRDAASGQHLTREVAVSIRSR